MLPPQYGGGIFYKEQAMKVLNFGSLNIDYVYSVDHFVKKGETVTATARNVFPGGKGLNQSIALKRAGCEVYHAGCVGEIDGSLLIHTLEQDNIPAQYIIKRTNIASGHAIIQNDKDGDNCIIIFGGANQTITEEDIDNTLADFEQNDWIVLQNEISNMPYILRTAKNKGMNVVLNPSPFKKEILTWPLDCIDVLILNEGEAAAFSMDTTENNIDDLIKGLRASGIRAGILLTLGDNGSVFDNDAKRIRQGIYETKVVDTTAAGDTYTGYFIASVLLGKSIEESMDMASKASAIAVSRSGATPSIPFRNEVDAWTF